MPFRIQNLVPGRNIIGPRRGPDDITQTAKKDFEIFQSRIWAHPRWARQGHAAQPPPNANW